MAIDLLIKEVESLNSNVCIEITDDYIRLTGNTYKVKGKLKLLGFQWNPNKREWYYSVKGINLNPNEPEGPTMFMA